ncbi:MAG: host-nuclease inhibitor Gam family protein [Verrucomicrobiota bacterium]
MSKQRIKINLPLITSRLDAEAAMNDLANTANNRRKFIAELDSLKLKLEEKYAAPIAACDADIKAKSDALRAWAEANPAEFGKRKSLDFAAGTLGFRTGTPKLKLLPRWTWVHVLIEIQNRAFNFIRNTPEVDKEAILTFYASATDKPTVEAKVLAPIGVKVVQDESFFVEPKLTDTEVQS